MTADVLPLPEPHRLAADTLRAIQAIYEERRQAHGLRQEDLAAAVGRPQSYVSRVLTGTKVLNLGDVENFARGYGISVLELMSRAVHIDDEPRQDDGIIDGTTWKSFTSSCRANPRHLRLVAPSEGDSAVAVNFAACRGEDTGVA